MRSGDRLPTFLVKAQIGKWLPLYSIPSHFHKSAISRFSRILMQVLIDASLPASFAPFVPLPQLRPLPPAMASEDARDGSREGRNFMSKFESFFGKNNLMDMPGPPAGSMRSNPSSTSAPATA